jgi:hypothetical protein
LHIVRMINLIRPSILTSIVLRLNTVGYLVRCHSLQIPIEKARTVIKQIVKNNVAYSF